MVLSPQKLVILKALVHKDYVRELGKAILEFGKIQPIDISHNDTRPAYLESDTELIRRYLDRVNKLISILEIDLTKPLSIPVKVINDNSLESVIHEVDKMLQIFEDEALHLESKINEIKSEITKISNIIDITKQFTPLGINLSILGVSDYLYTVAGIVPTGKFESMEWNLKQIEEENIVIRHVDIKGGRTVVVIAVLKDQKEAVDRVLSAFGFEKLTLPDDIEGTPQEIVAKYNEKLADLNVELDELYSKIANLQAKYMNDLIVAHELLEFESTLIQLYSYFDFEGDVVRFWGWIPKKYFNGFKSDVLLRTQENCEIIEIEEFNEEDEPTYLENPLWAKPAQGLVESYGVGHPNDWDPSKIIAFTFPIIFGLMFADVGHGFAVLLVGLLGFYALKKNIPVGDMLGLIVKGSPLIISMGIASMFFGFMFGSMFTYVSGEGEHAVSVLNAIWFSPHHDIIYLLKISILVGGLQMCMGIFLSFVGNLKNRNIAKAIGALAYLIMYTSFLSLIFGVGVNVFAWFTDVPVKAWPISMFGLTASQVLYFGTIAPFVIMMVALISTGIDGFVQFLENALGSISHTVSYARIFALNTVHEILGQLFYMVPALFFISIPEIYVFGFKLTNAVELPFLGALLGTIVVGILEGMIGFIHAMRLHYVEWFSKFYHAEGHRFKPFSFERKFTVSANVYESQNSQTGIPVVEAPAIAK